MREKGILHLYGLLLRGAWRPAQRVGGRLQRGQEQLDADS